MAYSKGSRGQSTDLNSIVGTTALTSAYASSAAATNQVAALLGVGFGDRGYGQTTPPVSAFTSGKKLLASDLLNLRNALANMASFQGTTLAGLPPTTDYVSGALAKGGYDLAAAAATLDTNRFNNNAGASLSVTAGALNITRAGVWGSGSTAITAEYTATFPSVDAARFFFNSGGAIGLVLSHPTAATTQDANWQTILAALGTINMGAKATTRSGSGGIPIALGYYGLTAAYQTIFNGATLGTGAYTANSVVISALTTAVDTTNGGNGTTVKIKVVLTDGHTNAFSDSVATGTKAAVGYTKAATVLTGIASPTLATVTNF
jgi:hypothetical protein